MLDLQLPDRDHPIRLRNVPVYLNCPFSGVLPLPVLVDGVRHLDQPGAVFGKLQHIRRAEKLSAVLRRVAQRLEQPGGNERRNIVRLTVEHPPRLLRREPRRLRGA